MSNKNQSFIGLAAGIILPVITLFLIYLVRFHHYEPGEFISSLIKLRIISKFLQLAAIPNLLLFFIFLWLNRPYASRGVIGATFILVLAILLFSFVL